MTEVAIFVPILNRPHRIEPLLANIAEATDVQYRVVFAASDQPSIDELDRLGCQYIRDEGGDEGSWGKRINRLYGITNESYFLTGADDLAFRPDWFQAARRVMDTINGGGVVGINDLLNPAGTHFVISRNYVQTIGGCVDGPGIVCHEGYRHAYVDDEIRETARSRGRYAYAKESVIEHLHPGLGKSPHDETYRIGENSMPQGRELYASRAHLWAI